MSNFQKIASHWRILAMILILCVLAFYKGCTPLFWIGFAIINFTDPKFRSRMNEPLGPLAYLLIPAVFLIMGIPLVFLLWALYYNTTFNPVFPELLMVVGFIATISIGFVVQKRAAKRQEILKDL